MEQSPARGEDLSDLERALIDSVANGIELDLAVAEPVDQAAMKAWGESKTVRASVIRDLLRGRHIQDPDPHGVRLRGAKIVGRLDLRGMTSGVSLALTSCYLTDGVSVRGAQLPVLRLAHCRAENPSLAPLDAQRFSTQVLDLRGLTVVTDARNTGAISLAYAHISGELDASGATLTNGSGPALDANRLQVDGDLRLRHGFDAVGSSRSGAVVLTGARIGGILDLSGAKLTNDAGYALAAEELRVDGVLLFTDRFEAVGRHVDGAVLLRGVHIGGQLVAVGATLTNESGPALSAARLRVDLDVFLIDGFSASGKGDDGAVLLRGAHIGGQLALRKATLANQAGPALSADRLQVDGDVFMIDGFSASGNKDTDGAVSLFGAHIGGQLAIHNAILTNDVGPALYADGLQVDGDLSLDGFSASGSGDAGAVSLVNADIGGQFTASAATLTNPSGPALSTAGLHVDGDLHLVDGFKADGWGQRGALLLSGAHIGGELEATGATVTNQGGPALCADDLRVDSDLLLNGEFTATGSSEAGVLVLNGTHIGGRISLDASSVVDASGKPGRLALDGLTYAGLPRQPPSAQWLEILQDRTSDYYPQPYRQLAEASRAAGHDAETRKILMAQRTHELKIRRPGTTRTERSWGKFTGVSLGYGYQPWRALVGLLGVVVLAVILSVSYGGQGGLAHTRASGSPGTACSALERVGVGLDFSIPVVNSGAGGACATTTSGAGNTITISSWVLQLTAWSLATLFIAGFTGAVRKT